jgi:hypothetical protein
MSPTTSSWIERPGLPVDRISFTLHEQQPPAAARARRFAAKNAPAGQRQIKTISVRNVRAGHWYDTLPAPASASGSGKDGFGRFRVSAACGADLVCLYRASPPPSTPWLW